MANKADKLRYLTHVDGLRAIAILAVVAYHAWPGAIPGGYIGVDVFFVISGFIITRQLQADMAAGIFSYADFLARRIRRLIPAAFVCTSLIAAAAFILLSPPHLVDYAKSQIAAWLMVANFYLMRTTGYFDGPSEEKPLLHIWSLAVEDQFYLTWPLLLLFLLRWLGIRGTLRIALPAVILLSLGHAQFSQGAQPDYAFYSPLTRAFELLTGCWLALAVASRNLNVNVLAGKVSGVLGFILILGSTFLLSPASPVPGLVIVPPIIGTALLIYSGLVGSNLASRFLSCTPLVAVGRISYSWYLYHWPLLAFARHALSRAPTNAETLFLVATGLVAAVASWAFVEEPFRRQTTSIRSALSGVMMASVGLSLVAGAILGARGFPGRLEKPIAQLYVAISEGNPYRRRCDGVENAFQHNDSCNFGAPKTRGSFDIAILGDSNADHFVPMISAIAKAASLSGRQITQSTCAPLLGASQKHGTAFRADLCARYQEAILRFLEENPNLRIVFLSAVWASWQGALIPNRVTNQIGADKVPRKDFNTVLEFTIAQFRNRGIRIVLLGQIPHLQDYDMRCFEHAARRGANDSACATPREIVERQLERPRETFKELAASDPFIQFFDPSRFLCSMEACGPFKDGEFLYRDFGHLNATGARHLARYGKELLN